MAAKSVHLTIRRGLSQWHIECVLLNPLGPHVTADINFREDDMTDLSCMTFLHKDAQHILAAGCQHVMYEIDVDKGHVVKRLETKSQYTMMKYNRYICAATSTGAIDFLDLGTLQVVKTMQAHTSNISSMDARNDFLITCGWSPRQNTGALGFDIFATVFDLKRLEQLGPIPFAAGAAFVQIHPKMSTTSVVCSRSGQVHVTDIMNAGNVKMIHVTLTSFLTALIMSPTGNVWAIADQENNLSLWGSPNNLHFLENPSPTEFADQVAPVAHMAVDSDLYAKLSCAGCLLG